MYVDWGRGVFLRIDLLHVLMHVLENMTGGLNEGDRKSQSSLI